jgi:hypothetical protein
MSENITGPGSAFAQGIYVRETPLEDDITDIGRPNKRYRTVYASSVADGTTTLELKDVATQDDITDALAIYVRETPLVDDATDIGSSTKRYRTVYASSVADGTTTLELKDVATQDDITAALGDALLKSGGEMKGPIDMSENKITDVGSLVLKTTGTEPAPGPSSGEVSLFAWSDGTLRYEFHTGSEVVDRTILTDASTLPAYLRIDGSSEMFGELKMGGFDISGVANLDISGAINSSGTLEFTANAGIKGTILGDNADPGLVGEYVEDTYSAVPLTSAVLADVGYLDLSAGDWDVSGNFQASCSDSNSMTVLSASISTTSGTHNLQTLTQFNLGSPFTGGGLQSFNISPTRVSLSASATVYLVGQANYATGTVNANAFMSARRVR